MEKIWKHMILMHHVPRKKYGDTKNELNKWKDILLTSKISSAFALQDKDNESAPA